MPGMPFMFYKHFIFVVQFFRLCRNDFTSHPVMKDGILIQSCR